MPANRASKLTLKVSNRSNASPRIEESSASAGGSYLSSRGSIETISPAKVKKGDRSRPLTPGAPRATLFLIVKILDNGCHPFAHRWLRKSCKCTKCQFDCSSELIVPVGFKEHLGAIGDFANIGEQRGRSCRGSWAGLY